ncbi:hypothetical protein DY000_02040747 [Brassica cretica]|uniref:Uncharacterized protein n=1 Tax=Brassica cretica TaxID=69181 RepID=A0ABQ7BEV2_BRACR|nr:hypothetical protein DY000_02040747 [Brassica cretica]
MDPGPRGRNPDPGGKDLEDGSWSNLFMEYFSPTLLREIQDPSLACQWMARLVGLAGEDHLYLLKSSVGDLLPRSEVGILDIGFALH